MFHPFLWWHVPNAAATAQFLCPPPPWQQFGEKFPFISCEFLNMAQYWTVRMSAVILWDLMNTYKCNARYLCMHYEMALKQEYKSAERLKKN